MRRGRILAVDDNATNLAIIEEILGGLQELETAASGEECLQRAELFRPDIVLLDIMMPGIDGYEVCRRIRMRPELRRTKVIMVSAMAMVEERLAGYRAGANDYICKPFDEDELLAKVEVFLNMNFREELDDAREAGMAQVASEVLHNVGNVLTSLKTSSRLAASRLAGARLAELGEIAAHVVRPEAIEGGEDSGLRSHSLAAYLESLHGHLQEIHEGVASELLNSRRDIDHVASIVQSHRSYAQGPQSIQTVDLAEMFQDALRMSGVDASENQVRVHIELPRTRTIVTDRHRVLSVLVNLLKNAREAHTPDASVEPELTLLAEHTEDGSTRILVEDNGCGFSVEEKERLFAYGFTTKTEGQGMGLHSAATAASALGGSIEAHSAGPGRGARFVLSLPDHADR